MSFSISVLFRPCQHSSNEKHHSDCWTGCFCSLSCDWLPLLLDKMVQKFSTATVQPQTAGIWEQRHIEADQRAAGGRRRVHLQSDGPAQQDGFPKHPCPCERSVSCTVSTQFGWASYTAQPWDATWKWIVSVHRLSSVAVIPLAFLLFRVHCRENGWGTWFESATITLGGTKSLSLGLMLVFFLVLKRVKLQNQSLLCSQQLLKHFISQQQYVKCLLINVSNLLWLICEISPIFCNLIMINFTILIENRFCSASFFCSLSTPASENN